MLILPSMYRPDSVRRFLKAYLETEAMLPVWLVLDAGNADQYRDVPIPTHFKKVVIPQGMRLGDMFNLLFRKYPNEEFYGMVADDVVPETSHWDILLKEACLPDKISWGWDSIQNEKLPVHPFIGGDLVRKLGFWAVPGLKHWYVDNAWKDIADGLGVAAYRPDIRMTHHHYVNGKAQKDRTYETQPNPVKDEIIYNKWKIQELPGILRRLSAG